MNPDFRSRDDDAMRDESSGMAVLGVVCLATILAAGIGIALFVLAARHMARHLGGF